MKRLRWVILAAVLSLVAAGAAIAHEIDGAKTTKFSATFIGSETRHAIRTCANSDGYKKAHHVFWGEASGDVEGRARVRLNSYGNELHKLSGNIRVWNGDGHVVLRAQIKAVGENGAATGFAHGRVHEGRLLATVAATYDTEGLTLQLGSGELKALGVVKGGHCARVRPHDHKPAQVKPKTQQDRKSDEAASNEKAA